LSDDLPEVPSKEGLCCSCPELPTMLSSSLAVSTVSAEVGGGPGGGGGGVPTPRRIPPNNDDSRFESFFCMEGEEEEEMDGV